MLDIKLLNDYSKYINIYQLCQLSDLCYDTILSKLKRYRAKPSNGKLKYFESRKLTKGFNRLGIEVVSNPIPKNIP